MNTITISEFFRVLNINWSDFLWGLFWLLSVLGVILFGIIITTIVTARQWFIKNELPRLHDEKIGKLTKENKRLKTEKEVLIEKRVSLLVENERLKVRLDQVRVNYEKGLEGE